MDVFLTLLLTFLAVDIFLTLWALLYVSSVKELIIRIWDELIRRYEN